MPTRRLIPPYWIISIDILSRLGALRWQWVDGSPCEPPSYAPLPPLEEVLDRCEPSRFSYSRRADAVRFSRADAIRWLESSARRSPDVARVHDRIGILIDLNARDSRRHRWPAGATWRIARDLARYRALEAHSPLLMLVHDRLAFEGIDVTGGPLSGLRTALLARGLSAGGWRALRTMAWFCDDADRVARELRRGPDFTVWLPVVEAIVRPQTR